jgi:hypothetical protein
MGGGAPRGCGACPRRTYECPRRAMVPAGPGAAGGGSTADTEPLVHGRPALRTTGLVRDV